MHRGWDCDCNCDRGIIEAFDVGTTNEDADGDADEDEDTDEDADEAKSSHCIFFSCRLKVFACTFALALSSLLILIEMLISIESVG